MKYLMTLPGIGLITASQLLARIGDWRELNNIRQLGGFLGLVPTDTTNKTSPRNHALLLQDQSTLGILSKVIAPSGGIPLGGRVAQPWSIRRLAHRPQQV